MIVSLEKHYQKALAESLRVLMEEGVLVFPTDTVYGIGGDARSARALERVRAIKGREEGKPIAVVMSGLDMIMEWCEVGDATGKALMEHLPGPYTFILKLKRGKALAGQDEKVGVRVPNHFFLRKLALEFGAPLAATSANPSGWKDAARLEDVEPAIRENADLCIDGGKTQLGQSSTVVDLVERKILRKGAGEFEFK